MTVVDEISELVNRMVESGIEVPDFILMSHDKFNVLNCECGQSSRYTYAGYEYNDPKPTAYQIYTAVGPLTIYLGPSLPSNYLSIGRITLDDFIIEDMLFHEDNIDIDSST